MKRWEDQIIVNAPADKVFEYVSDFTRHGEWAEHGLTATKITDGPVGPGTKYATVAKQFGTQREESTVTEYSPGHKFAWDSTGALGRINHWFSVADNGGTTTLKKGSEVVGPTFLGKLFGLKLAKDQPKGLRNALAKIKSNVEGSARA